MAIQDELRHLESYLVDEFEKGHKISDLYELVQYAGNIIPRLYLLVTVGAVYIQAKQVPTKDILKDLVEMCRGVQHPLRGLFLRNYLLSCVKRHLPEEVIETKHGSVADSIEFVLLNFSEMNKLWVRMQHQGHSRNKAQREKERRELRILVGTNLVRLSSLEGVPPDTYVKRILPAIMEQITSCKDPIAQEYLMECIIQVFPDELHLRTLGPFLDACSRLNLKVNVKNIIIALIERLATFAAKDAAAIPDEMDLFKIFSEKAARVVEARSEMSIEDILQLQIALAKLVLKVYRDKSEYMDQVFEFTANILKAKEITNVMHSQPGAKELVQLIKTVIDEYESIAQVLKLPHFVPLFDVFSHDLHQELAVNILQSVTERGTQLDEVELVEAFLLAVSPAVQDNEAQNNDDVDPDDFSEEQSLMGRFITLLNSDVADVQYQILNTTKTKLSVGGEQRIKYTMPPLVFQAFKLARRYATLKEEDPVWEKKVKKIFEFCHKVITGLTKAEYIDLAFRLFLQAALTADKIEFEQAESIAYEFMSQVRGPHLACLLVHSCGRLQGERASTLAVHSYVAASVRLGYYPLGHAGVCCDEPFLQYSINCLKCVMIFESEQTTPCPGGRDASPRVWCAFGVATNVAGALPLATPARPIQAITLYEEEISDSNAQTAAITLLIGSLEAMSCFGEENFTTLATKCALMSSKLVKKPDQANGVCLCSHVFWSSVLLGTKAESRDGKQVKKCLNKAGKIAKSCMEPLVQAAIFVEVLNRCVLYNGWGAEEITYEYIDGIIGECKEALDKLEESAELEQIQQYFDKTVEHIEKRKAAA